MFHVFRSKIEPARLPVQNRKRCTIIHPLELNSNQPSTLTALSCPDLRCILVDVSNAHVRVSHIVTLIAHASSRRHTCYSRQPSGAPIARPNYWTARPLSERPPCRSRASPGHHSQTAGGDPPQGILSRRSRARGARRQGRARVPCMQPIYPAA